MQLHAMSFHKKDGQVAPNFYFTGQPYIERPTTIPRLQYCMLSLQYNRV